MSNDSKHTPGVISENATSAAMKFAMDAIKGIPRDNAEMLEAHLTAVLIVFWGALWGSMGTDYARDFIEAQLRGMEPDVEHDVFFKPQPH